jgi:DNA-binding transcriptional regulator YdaS (Cro superfamily)
MTHPLDTHLKSTSTSRAAFAARIGRSRQYVSNLINGHVGATLRTAFQIEDATGGEVTARSIDEHQP